MRSSNHARWARWVLAASMAVLAPGCSSETVRSEGPTATTERTRTTQSAEPSQPAPAISPPATTSAPRFDGDEREPAPAYTPDALLAAMLASRRPGGTPDRLETRAVVEALAPHVQTLGGEPWATLSVGGSCGPDRCTLEVGGTPSGDSHGEDLYIFSIDPTTASVQLLESNLRGIAVATVIALDRAARTSWEGDLSTLRLGSARWLPPPASGSYVLSYRSGGEEGSPAIDLLINAATGEIRSLDRTGG